MGGEQVGFPAVFIRGGTSKGVFFHRRDLPVDQDAWSPIFLAALGSPDPYGRQLNGMGGGISSLSKVAIIAPSLDSESDVDFTFGQVAVDESIVDYSSTCGNLTAAVGPFAVDEGLVAAVDGEAIVRIFNTNTGRRVVSRFRVADGKAAVDGDLVLTGVAGAGAPISLDFLEPGGAGTGTLLPTGAVVDDLGLPDASKVRASLVDASNACAFVNAADVGLRGNELPGALEETAALARLEVIRRAAGVRMGIGPNAEAVGRASKSSPKIALVAAPVETRTLDGRTIPAAAMDLSMRMISMGKPHRAAPLTGVICVAVAALLEGSVVNSVTSAEASWTRAVRIGTPSGVVTVNAIVEKTSEGWKAASATVLRTARRLMEGRVLVPSSYIRHMPRGETT